MNSATIVVKKPGLYVPDELLSTVSTKCPTAFGFAGRAEGKLVCEISPKSIAIAELKQLQDAFKDETLVMYFANFPKAVMPDDIMPWSVKVGDEHIVMLFAEGDVNDYVGMNGDHTGEYNAFDEVVFPRLNKAMIDAGEDLDKFFDELRKPGFQKTLGNIFKDRGVFVILPQKGDAICFGDSKLGGAYDWGTTSNMHGYVAKTEAAPVVKPGLSFLRGGGTTSTKPNATPDIEVPVTAPEVPEPEPSGGDGLPLKPGKENSQMGTNPAIVGKTPQQLEAAGWKKMFPPPKLAKGSARNLWLRSFNAGRLPPDHESSECSVWVPADIIDIAKRTASSKKDVENITYAVSQRRKAMAQNPGGAVNMDLAHKELETASAAAEILTGKGEKPVTSGKSTVREAYVPSGAPSNGSSEFLPTMTDDEKLKAMVIMDEYFKKDKQPTPLEVQKGESKHATFSEATGYKFTDLLFLPVEQITKLFDGNKIAVAAFVEMRRNYLDKTDLKLEDLVISTKIEKEEPKKEEPKASVPSVQPQPQPKKASGGLAFLRKAG
jgi:hypothetical protein